MNQPYSRGVPDSLRGVYTWGISDCSVFAIIERANGSFGRFFFLHVPGGNITMGIRQAVVAAIGGGGDNFFAVIADQTGGVAFGSANQLFTHLNIPPANRYYYTANADFHFGVDLRAGWFGECENNPDTRI